MLEFINSCGISEAAAISEALALLAEHLDFIEYAGCEMNVNQLSELVGNLSNEAAFHVDNLLEKEEKLEAKRELNSIYGAYAMGVL